MLIDLKVSLRNIIKVFSVFFMIYINWMKYPFGDIPVLLYGTAIISFVAMISDYYFSENKRSRFSVGVYINLIMCCYSIITGVFFAINTNMLITSVKTYFAFSCVCIAINYISLKEGIDWIIKALIAISVICCVQVAINGYYFRGYGYVMSADNNPNSFGLTLVTGVFALAYHCKTTNKSILLHFSLAGVFIYFIAGCGSRKSLLAAIIILALWILPLMLSMFQKRKISARIGFLFLIAIACYAILYFYFNVYINNDSYERMQTLGDLSERSTSFRFYYYEKAFDLFCNYPVFGAGLYQFGSWVGYPETYSHSTYAEAICSWGFFGTLIYFTPIICCVFKAIKISIKNKDYRCRIVLALCITELFLGLGQIFFYSAVHMIIWTLIFCYIDSFPQSFSDASRKDSVQHVYY